MDSVWIVFFKNLKLIFLNRFYDIKNNFIKIKNIILINFQKKKPI
jgi:hypothetical protein